MTETRSVENIIDAIGVTALQRAFGHANASTVSSWKQRRSIPVERWPRLIEVAKERGLADITIEALLKACIAREQTVQAAQ